MSITLFKLMMLWVMNSSRTWAGGSSSPHGLPGSPGDIQLMAGLNFFRWHHSHAWIFGENG